MGGRVAAAAVKGQINVIPWEACMRACGEPCTCRVVRSAFTRRWRAGGDWRLAVVAVPADVSQWVSARGAAGRRARVCRHTDSKHGVCPRAHVWGARRTRRRSSELGAGDDSRDTVGRLRTTRGFIRVCAKNHSRGMHAGSRSNRAFLVLRVRLSVHGPNMGLSTSRRYVTLHAARVWDRQVVP